MRRSDLAVTDPTRIDEIIRSCDCVRFAFADGSHPYIVPLSFGYRREDDAPVFYVHSAAAGRKVDLARNLRYAAFELDTNCAVNQSDKACKFSMRYQSVMGEGDLFELTDPTEKANAMGLIMKQYSGRSDWEFPAAVLEKTTLFRLVAKEISGKEHH